jgi:hypothetical protein
VRQNAISTDVAGTVVANTRRLSHMSHCELGGDAVPDHVAGRHGTICRCLISSPYGADAGASSAPPLRVANHATSTAAAARDCAADISANHGRDASVSTSPGHAALIRRLRALRSRSVRASTRTAATCAIFDATLIHSGQPTSAARPCSTSATQGHQLRDRCGTAVSIARCQIHRALRSQFLAQRFYQRKPQALVPSDHDGDRGHDSRLVTGSRRRQVD